MGKWATYQKRGGTRTTPAETPILSFNGTDTILWTWGSADPVQWSIETAGTSSGPWTSDDQVSGSDRSYDQLTNGRWYTVIGIDGSGNPVTPRSNAVNVP